MIAVAVAAGAYMLWHTPLPPDPDGGDRCARAFDARLRVARGGSDADLAGLGGYALAARCGRQAFEAFAAIGDAADEGAAWTLARFYDPRETDAVFREAVVADPQRAAAIARAWRDRSPRMASVLERLCAAEPVVKDTCAP